MTQQKVAREVAVVELQRLADGWRIDTRKEHMDADDRQGFDNIWNTLLTSIETGYLTVNEDGKSATQTLEDGEQLELRAPKGAGYLTMDQHKQSKDMHKTFSILGAMCGRPVKWLANMEGVDVKLSLAVVQLYSG